MTITACGPICDVGGEYILLESMTEFNVAGINALLHTCESHLPVLQAAAGSGQWRDLPEGPLRQGFEKAAAE